MADTPSFLDRIRQKRMRGYWMRKTKEAGRHQNLIEDARKLRRVLQEFELASSNASIPPPNAKAGLPKSTIWAERPPLWTSRISDISPGHLDSGVSLGGGATLYHDSQASSVHAAQTLGPEMSAAPYALTVETEAFEGDYVSLALGLPAGEIAQIERSDVLRIDVDFVSHPPVNALARANIKIGPNVESVVREIDPTRARKFVEFDLFFVELEAQTISDVWIDLIFERPTDHRITIYDLRLSRRPRARS